eukprot:CAMPEP_0185290868 /NCGR_PEP_ID=MMETSP1363-20130426/4912_1 /TAXON_ID=38817 /ORGANISM="Gephyrocapsa oceanica, Strain RCC1303" /LENGTH=277 /DNA_ID=CAMNT_0027886925 /DNA_START=57 /DNA_END=891 /DNA_ORIENTATION=-
MPTAIFSAAPLDGIDIEALPPSRFLLQRERRFPYRDLKGRVNFHLVAALLEEVEAGKVGEAALADTIRAWHRHADRALADERLTLDELLHASKRKRAAASPAAAAAAPAGSRLRTVAERGLVTPTRRKGRQPRDATPPTRPRAIRNFLRHAPDSDDSKEDPVYEVHSLLDERAEGDEPHFLVRWSGFGSEDDTWEPEAGLSPALVSAFRLDKAVESALQARITGPMGGRYSSGARAAAATATRTTSPSPCAAPLRRGAAASSTPSLGAAAAPRAAAR